MDVIKISEILTSKFKKKLREAGGAGKGFGSLQTPQSKKIYSRARSVEEEERDEKTNESQVHPDDKIGQMMLKKMGVPNYFETRGIETHQKRVDKDDDDKKSGNPKKKDKDEIKKKP